VDWESANVVVREKFGFTDSRVRELLVSLSGASGVLGCAILSTCNRCEVFLSVDGDAECDPTALLCSAAGLDAELFAPYFRTFSGEASSRRLFEIACGLRSQIIGEEQILTQLRGAMTAARETRAADGALQTLFRLAITAGKEARTRVRLTGVPTSVAEMAVLTAARRLGGLDGKRAVVIGNGEMGRLAAELLNRAGCRVTVTLRSYRHGETIVPQGCETVNYDERERAIDGCDLVCSATTSPHHTLTARQISALARPPRVIIDLAVPRDVEPEVANVAGVSLLDMDGIGGGEQMSLHNVEALRVTDEIIEKHSNEFYRWAAYRERNSERSAESTSRSNA
jgi:glutamyl-tRNA reductase